MDPFYRKRRDQKTATQKPELRPSCQFGGMDYPAKAPTSPRQAAAEQLQAAKLFTFC